MTKTQNEITILEKEIEYEELILDELYQENASEDTIVDQEEYIDDLYAELRQLEKKLIREQKDGKHNT